MLTDKYPYNIGPLWNNEYEAVRLKDVDAASLVSKKLCDPYIMGYVPTEKYPGNFFFNVTSLSSDQRTISFTNILAQKNIGWGFAIVGNYNLGTPNMLAITNSNALYNTSSLPNNDCIVLINKVQMAKMCTRATLINCMLSGLIMPIDDEPSDDAVFFVNTYSRWKTSTLQIGISDYKAMMDSAGSDNPSRFRFSINFDGANRYFNICDDDFNDFNIAKLHDENNEYTLYCTITNFTVNENRSYYGYSGTSTEVRCTPFYRIPLTEDNTQNLSTDICACFMPFYGYGSHDWRFAYNTGTDTLSIGGSAGAWNFAGYDIGNFPYTIDLDELQSISSFNYNHDGIVYGKYLINQKGYGSGYWSFSIIRQNRFSDGWKQYALYHKSFVNGETYYASDYPKYNGKFEVSLFDENDTPLLTREPTLSTYAEMYDKLRPWQKLEADITVNDFDPANIPEWEPPEPGEDDERTSGSWRTNSDLVNFGNANGFVTQYVITGNQLQSLGQYLWSGFWDEDFIDSIMVSFLENFSLYPADILKYFVSIRKYPLDLNTLSYNLGWASEIYIGRGKKGIKLDNSTNTIGVLPNFAHNIRTEWKEIPSNFHDFRDYEPCCRVVIFVPFCGEVELTPSQAIDSEVRLEYCIDFSNGAVECAVVIRPKEKPSDLYIAAVLTGSMGASIQLSASNLTQFLMNGTKAITGQVQSLIQDIGTAVTLAAGAMEAGEGTSIDKGKYLGGLTSTAGGHVGDSLSSIMGATGTPVPKFGNNSGFSSFLVLTPNIQITYRWYEQPSNYGHAVGYSCNKAVKIKDLEGKGFSVFRNVDLSGVPATQDELAAIEALLQSGVYL